MKATYPQSPASGTLEAFTTQPPAIAWINIKGDSMTSGAGVSIPDNSKVLIRRIDKDPFGIPTRKPVVIMGTHAGRDFLVCKLITFVDMVYNQVKCESLNKKYQPFYLPLDSINEIFEVVEVQA